MNEIEKEAQFSREIKGPEKREVTLNKWFPNVPNRIVSKFLETFGIKDHPHHGYQWWFSRGDINFLFNVCTVLEKEYRKKEEGDTNKVNNQNISKERTYSLPKSIVTAIAHYYAHAYCASKGGKEWDKQKDLLEIGKQAKKHKFSLQASAGTFWFKRKTRSMNVTITYETNERDFPMARKVTLKIVSV